MKKGFTLVELLGVIVVLAIIALILVPSILGIVEKSKKGALKESANGLVDAGILYYAEYQNENTVRFDIKDNEITSKEEKKIKYKGNIKDGTVLVNNNGEVVVCINDGKYAAYKNFKDKKITIVDDKTCNVNENSNIVYLDNESTMDTNIEELLTKIENLEQEVLNLKKLTQTEITTSINNVTVTHNTDMTFMNNKLGNMDISSIGNGTITGALTNLDTRMLTKEGVTKQLKRDDNIDTLYLENTKQELHIFTYPDDYGNHVLFHSHYSWPLDSEIYYGVQLDMNYASGLRFRTLNGNTWSAWKKIG